MSNREILCAFAQERKLTMMNSCEKEVFKTHPKTIVLHDTKTAEVEELKYLKMRFNASMPKGVGWGRGAGGRGTQGISQRTHRKLLYMHWLYEVGMVQDCSSRHHDSEVKYSTVTETVKSNSWVSALQQRYLLYLQFVIAIH